MAINSKDIGKMSITSMDITAGATGPIDWSKVTINSSSIANGTIKVTETPQKTVFANRLMAQAKLSDLALTTLRGDMELFQHYKDELVERVRKAACEESKCGACPQMKISILQDYDPMMARRHIAAVAMCGLDKSGFTSVMCPDGTVASRTGSVRTTSFEEIPEVPKSPPEFSTKNEEPYIRIDPDKPSSAGSEVAW